MRRLFPLLLLLLPLPASAETMTPSSFEALRAVDTRMATIAYRLTSANAALCTDLQPVTGWAIHARNQYAAALTPVVRQVFGFATPVAVELVVPDGPAARAGVRANDGLVAVDGRAFPADAPGESTSVTRDAATALVAAQPAGPLTLAVLRDGARQDIRVAATPGCRAQFEVLLGPKMTAESDGRIVQLGVRFFERYSDAETAVVVAHELSHIILRHRARLEAAGVKWGLLSEIGRNARLFRQTEEDADRLSVWLLRNAGYDPASAPRFWREHGGEVDGGLFRARTHPSSSARAKVLDAEIASMPAAADPAFQPPVLATRDRPLS